VYDFDIAVTGHDHQKMIKKMVRLGITNNGSARLVTKPIMLAKTGTFMKTVSKGDMSYSERAGYVPVDIGTVQIKVKIEGKKHNLTMRGIE